MFLFFIVFVFTIIVMIIMGFRSIRVSFLFVYSFFVCDLVSLYIYIYRYPLCYYLCYSRFMFILFDFVLCFLSIFIFC